MNCKAEERLNAWLGKYFGDECRNLPFSFTSGERLISGNDEWQLLGRENVSGKDQEVESITMKEPSTGLEVIFEKVEYDNHPAVEWVVYGCA